FFDKSCRQRPFSVQPAVTLLDDEPFIPLIDDQPGGAEPDISPFASRHGFHSPSLCEKKPPALGGFRFYSTLNLPFFKTRPAPPIMYNARLSIIFFMNDARLPVTFLPKTTPIASSSPRE